MNKKIIKITLTLGIILLSVCFSFIFNQDIYAGSVGNSGKGYSGDYGKCSIGTSGSWACVKQYQGKYGGVSWRYYPIKKAQDPVVFDAKPGTGVDVEVENCSGVGGFYFLGFEAYNSTVGYRGFQIPSISIKHAYELSAYKIQPGSGIGTTSSDASNDRGLTGDIVSWEQAKEAFNEAKRLGIITDSASFEKSDKEWFCAKELPEEEEEEKPKPETAEFQARSEVSIDGRRASVGYSSQPKAAGASTTKNWEQAGQKITIYFSHNLKKVGNAEKTSQYHVVFNGSEYIDSGTTRSTYAYQYPREVDIPAKNSQATYCSKILFDNGLGQTDVKSEVCASISVGEKSFNVTFVGDNNIYASESFEVTEDPGIGLEQSPTGNYRIPSGTRLSGLNLKVVDKTIPLKFVNTITRTDNNDEVSQAGTLFYVTNPALTPSSTILQQAGGLSLQSLKGAAKDASGYSKTEGGWLDLFANTKLAHGATATVHAGTAKMEVKSTEKEVCQAIAYLPARLVDKNGNSIVLKDSISFLAKLFKLSVCVIRNLIAQAFGLGTPDSSCREELDAATQAGIQATLSLAQAIQDNFAQGLEGNYGLAYSCVTFQQALNFKLKPEIAVSDEIALVGETISIDTNKSKITSTPLDDGTLTQTSPLEIETVVFQANENSVNPTNLQGTVDANNTANTKEPCVYFSGITKPGTSCQKITEFSHSPDSTDTKIIDSGDGSKKIAPFNSLFPAKTYSYPVGDLPTGSLICFATGVKDADSNSFNNREKEERRWAISGATCRTVAKKPSLQVHDGSVYSAGKVETLLTNKTLSNEVSQTLYGSWVEYGLIGKNAITGLASGAQLRNGSSKSEICDDNANPFATLSPLTIANKGCALGKSEITVNFNILQRFNTLFTQAAQSQSADSTTPSFNLSSSGGSDTVIKNFTNHVSVSGTATVPHIIYGANGITISGDIAAGPNAPVILISDGDIIINNDVTQVDAWLVAENNSVITCQYGIGDFSDESSSCGNRLSINGPVFAKGLKPYRAAGSGVGHINSLVPAETFTLPASTYVWAYNYASSDKFYPAYQRELAPRY